MLPINYNTFIRSSLCVFSHAIDHRPINRQKFTCHIEYFKENIKVSLFALILSSNVADALAYCLKSLKLPKFENCEVTIEFCRNMNNIFDFLNTIHFLSKLPYKRPLSEKNFEHCNSFIDFSISYINSLKDKDHVPITKSIRKTRFNGFIYMLQKC